MNLTFPEVLDSTIVSAYRSCPELFNKQYRQHWKPKGLSVHLHAGSAFAKGLEVTREAYFVNGWEAEDALATGMEALMTAYGTYQCPADSAKSLERMLGAMEYYFQQWPLSRTENVPIILPGGRHGIEFSFAHPLPILHPETGNPLLYCGRLDSIINYAGGVYMEDDKTTSSLGATWSRQWDLRSQFTGYAWGCREGGVKVAGVIVRGVSILKTKYDKAECITYRPEWQIDRWYQQLLELIEDEMLRDWKRNRYHYNLDKTCADFGGCVFRQACQSQDETPWLEQYFEKRVWNPITRKETNLDGSEIPMTPGAVVGLPIEMGSILDQQL